MSDSDNMLMDQEALTVRQPKARHWVWFGLAVATVGFVAVLSTSFKPRHSTFAMHISHGHSLMRAFTGRVLAAQADNPGFTSSSHFLINEAGAEAPSAMSINSKLVKVEHPDKVAFVTVKAKEGKEAALQTALEELLNETLKLMGEMKGEDMADLVRQHVSVNKSEGHVAIKVLDPTPLDVDDMEKDFESAPDFNLNLSFGSGLKELMENKEAHFPVALKSLGVDGSLAMSEAILKDSEEHLPPHMGAQLDLTRLIMAESLSLELLYRPDGDFSKLPTVGDLTALMANTLSEFPREFLDKLAGLDQFIDGVTSVKVGGLPGKLQLEVEFNNFHIAPMLREVIDNIPEPKPIMW